MKGWKGKGKGKGKDKKNKTKKDAPTAENEAAVPPKQQMEEIR